MRAAMFGSAEDDVESAADRRLERMLLRQARPPTSGMVASGLFQLVRDAGHCPSECRHLLRLEQLMVDVARFVVEFLALADVADEGFDVESALRNGARGELYPDRRA